MHLGVNIVLKIGQLSGGDFSDCWSGFWYDPDFFNKFFNFTDNKSAV
jgi:hypothetical protein